MLASARTLEPMPRRLPGHHSPDARASGGYHPVLVSPPASTIPSFLAPPLRIHHLSTPERQEPGEHFDHEPFTMAGDPTFAGCGCSVRTVPASTVVCALRLDFAEAEFGAR